MKKLLIFLILDILMLTVAVSAQDVSVRYQSQAISSRGLPLANQNVAVCTQPANTNTQPCSPLATLATGTSTSSGGANPTTTDANGNFFFYAAPSKYTVQIYGPQVSGQFVQPDTVLSCSPTGNCIHSGTETFNGTTNVGVLGNVDLKPAVSDQNLFVTNNGNDSNDGRSWGSAKLTIAGACAALPGGNSGCSAGSGTIYVSPSFSGTLTQPAVTTISILAPNSTGSGANWLTFGSFGNTQMVELNENDVNGANVKTEFQAVQGGSNYADDGVSGAIATPVGATQHNVNAVGGYANTSSASQGTGGTVGGYFQCRALVNSSKCFGANAVAIDATPLTTGVFLQGLEIDTQPQNAVSAYSLVQGLQIALYTPTAGTFTGSKAVNIQHGQTGIWDTGILIDNGNVANGALVAGATCGTGTCGSTFVDFKSLASSSQNQVFLQSNSSGQLLLTNQGNSQLPVGVSGNSSGTHNDSGFYQTATAAGCTTAASIGGVCATPITVTWPAAFADTNYKVKCGPVGAATNLPGTPYAVTKSTGNVTVNYFAITAAAASWPNIECIAVHN